MCIVVFLFITEGKPYTVEADSFEDAAKKIPENMEVLAILKQADYDKVYEYFVD